MTGGPSLRRPGRRITSAQPGFWPASHSRPSLSSLRERGSTDRNRPPWPAMWFMFAVVASLLSATYKNPGCPAIARQACQVAMWVVESSVFPSAILKVNGTAPSAQVVKIHTSCFRSGRWSSECPRAGRAGPAPPPGAGIGPGQGRGEARIMPRRRQHGIDDRQPGEPGLFHEDLPGRGLAGPWRLRCLHRVAPCGPLPAPVTCNVTTASHPQASTRASESSGDTMAEPTGEETAAQRALADPLSGLGFALPGTLTRRYTRCGNRTCRCHRQPPQLHGPYLQWTRTEDGKTVSRIWTPGQAARYQDWLANARQARQVLTDLEKLGAAIAERDQRDQRRQERQQPRKHPAR